MPQVGSPTPTQCPHHLQLSEHNDGELKASLRDKLLEEVVATAHSSWNSTRTRHDSGDGDVVGHHAHDAHPSFALAVPVAGELEADSPTAAEAGAPGNQGSEPGAAYGLASRQLPTNRPPRSRADANASDPA